MQKLPSPKRIFGHLTSSGALGRIHESEVFFVASAWSDSRLFSVVDAVDHQSPPRVHDCLLNCQSYNKEDSGFAYDAHRIVFVDGIDGSLKSCLRETGTHPVRTLLSIGAATLGFSRPMILNDGSVLVVRSKVAEASAIVCDEIICIPSLNAKDLDPQVAYSSRGAIRQLTHSSCGGYCAFVEFGGDSRDRWNGCKIVVLANCVPIAADRSTWQTIFSYPSTSHAVMASPQFWSDSHSLGFWGEAADGSCFLSLCLTTLALKIQVFSNIDIGDYTHGSHHCWLPLTSQTLVMVAMRRSSQYLLHLNLESGVSQEIPSCHTHIQDLAHDALGRGFWCLGSAAYQKTSLWKSWNHQVTELEYQQKSNAPLGAKPCVNAFRISESHNPQSFYKKEDLRWKNPDGQTIHGLYYHPLHLLGTACPTITLIHGGPHIQVYDGWQSKAAYFCSQGYGLFFVNFRGSTGYGQAFRKAYSHLSQIASDVVSGIEHLDTLSQTNGIHALWGGRFGGLGATHAAKSLGDRLKLLVLVFTPLRDLLGDSPYEPAYQELLNLRCPMGLFLGDQDPLTSQSATDKVLLMAEQNQIPLQLKVFPKTSGEFLNYEHYVDYYQSLNRLFYMHLKPFNR